MIVIIYHKWTAIFYQIVDSNIMRLKSDWIQTRFVGRSTVDVKSNMLLLTDTVNCYFGSAVKCFSTYYKPEQPATADIYRVSREHCN